jgi:hypothetical protein
MKRMSIALCAAAGLAATTVAMAAPAPAVASSGVSAGTTELALEAPVRRCIVVDPAAAGTNREADRSAAVQVVPTSCS